MSPSAAPVQPVAMDADQGLMQARPKKDALRATKPSRSIQAQLKAANEEAAAARKTLVEQLNARADVAGKFRNDGATRTEFAALGDEFNKQGVYSTGEMKAKPKLMARLDAAFARMGLENLDDQAKFDIVNSFASIQSQLDNQVSIIRLDQALDAVPSKK